jgi:hypothetical protein
MRITEVCSSWVVYRMTRPNQATTGNVVCEQAEWDAIEASRPGFHTLLQSGIETEQEAEKLARGTAGDLYRRGQGKKPSAREAADRVIRTAGTL